MVTLLLVLADTIGADGAVANNLPIATPLLTVPVWILEEISTTMLLPLSRDWTTYVAPVPTEIPSIIHLYVNTPVLLPPDNAAVKVLPTVVVPVIVAMPESAAAGVAVGAIATDCAIPAPTLLAKACERAKK